MDTLPTYTVKHFDQSINTAVAEDDTDLTDEIKVAGCHTQWPCFRFLLKKSIMDKLYTIKTA